MNNNPNALPSYNIADVDNEIGFYKTLFHLHDKGAMSCLPAIVEKYDRATHIAEVKPLVKSTMRLEDEEVPFDRPTYRVPVQQMCHGGFNIDAPLFVGDTGLLFAIDREWITARKRNSAALKEPQDPKKGEENPNKGAVVPDSYGLASFEYGFFLPCSWAKTDLKDEDGFVVRLPVKDGEVIIRIDKDGKTTFSGDVVFNNPVTFKDKITGTEGEFSGLIKANDFKTDDCEILELDVVMEAVVENGITTLKIGKFKFLRSAIIGKPREIQVVGGGGSSDGLTDVLITSENGSVSVTKNISGRVVSFNIETVMPEIPEGIVVSPNNTVELGEVDSDPTVTVLGNGTESNPLLFQFLLPKSDTIVDVTNEEASVSAETTTTPITFILESGATIGPINIVAKNGVNGTDGTDGEDGVGIQNITYATGDSGITVTITLTNNTTSSFVIPTAPATSKEIDVITDIALSYDSESGALTLSRTKKMVTVIAAEEDAESSTTESTVTLFNLENLTTVVSDVAYNSSNLTFTKKTIQVPRLIETTENSEDVFIAAKHETDI